MIEVTNFIKSHLLFFIILGMTIVIARIFRLIIGHIIKKNSRILRADPTQFMFMRHFSVFMIYLVGLSVAIYFEPSLRQISYSLLAGAGVLAVVLGFASQEAFSNIINGIFLVIFKPFRVGDLVKINEIQGTVEDITLRHTVIKNFQNNRIIIPNSVMDKEIILNENIQDNKICKWVEFGISYDSDIDKAIKIIQRESAKHPTHIDQRTQKEIDEGKPEIKVKVVGFGDSSVKLRGYVWAKDPLAAYHMGFDLNKSIKQAFDKEGIEIPFPYRTIVYKSDLEKKARKSKK